MPESTSYSKINVSGFEQFRLGKTDNEKDTGVSKNSTADKIITAESSPKNKGKF